MAKKQFIIKLVNRAKKDCKISRPAIAGAYMRNGKTYITNGIFGLIHDQKFDYLEYLDIPEVDTLPLERVIPTSELEQITNIPELNTTHNYIKLANEYYNVKYVNMLFEALKNEDPTFYWSKQQHGNEYLIIKTPTAIAVLCPVRLNDKTAIFDGEYADDKTEVL